MAKKNTMGSNPNMIGPDSDWRTEGDLRTLLEAEEIREDKTRMTAVRALAKEKVLDMAKISVMPDDKPEAGDKD